MNRPLLIIICDFLLISLLSLAKFEPASTNGNQTLSNSLSPQRTNDMVAVLKTALASEQQVRETLSSQLDSAQESLENSEQALVAKDSKIALIEKDLEEVEGRAQQLQNERVLLQQQYTDTQKSVSFLQDQFLEASSEAKRLQNDLNRSEQSAVAAKTKLQMIESELNLRRSEVLAMQAKMESLEAERQDAEQQRFQLALELKQSQTTEIIVREQFDAAKDEIREARQDVAYSREQVSIAQSETSLVREEASSALLGKERADERAGQLAEGIAELVQRNEAMAEQLQAPRSMTPSAIYARFLDQRLLTRFQASRSGTFGNTITQEKNSYSIVVSNGSDLVALYHTDQTPIQLWSGSSEWEQMAGRVEREQKAYSCAKICFIDADPRVLSMPVGARQAQVLGLRPFELAEDPLAHDQVILVDPSLDGDAYGAFDIRLSANYSNYLEVSLPALERLSQSLVPSPGHLVFNPVGELVGIMVNDSHCLVIDGITESGDIPFGYQTARSMTDDTFSRQAERLAALPRVLR